MITRFCRYVGACALAAAAAIPMSATAQEYDIGFDDRYFLSGNAGQSKPLPAMEKSRSIALARPTNDWSPAVTLCCS